MVRYLYFAFSDCNDPEREVEFNNWYSDMHIPNMFEVPGMLKATRWMNAEAKEGQHRKYLALYELETDNIDESNIKVRERGMRTMKEGRFSELPVFDPPDVPRIYTQIIPTKKAKRPRK